jgi:hypothetical protein
LNQGYVSLSLPGVVTGYGIFRNSAPGRGDQEAVVPLSGASSTTSTLIWDDTNFTTAVAIVNPSSLNTTVTIVVRDESGAIIGTSTLSMVAKSKTAVALRDLPVENAVSQTWSNGPAEGHINRLNTLKRQMCGRARFDLLRTQLLPLPVSELHQT